MSRTAFATDGICRDDRIVPAFIDDIGVLYSAGAHGRPDRARPLKQIGGVKYGAGLDVENWALEHASAGRVVVLRSGHGELYL